MGLLKHAILPIFALFHAFMTFMLLSGSKADIPTLGNWPDAEDHGDLSSWESHMMGTALSAHAAFLFGCLTGVMREDSHFRSILAVMEGIFFTLEAYDCSLTGFDVPPVATFAVLAWVGAIVNFLEPGIFTKDKTKAKGE